MKRERSERGEQNRGDEEGGNHGECRTPGGNRKPCRVREREVRSFHARRDLRYGANRIIREQQNQRNRHDDGRRLPKGLADTEAGDQCQEGERAEKGARKAVGSLLGRGQFDFRLAKAGKRRSRKRRNDSGYRRRQNDERERGSETEDFAPSYLRNSERIRNRQKRERGGGNGDGSDGGCDGGQEEEPYERGGDGMPRRSKESEDGEIFPIGYPNRFREEERGGSG